MNERVEGAARERLAPSAVEADPVRRREGVHVARIASAFAAFLAALLVFWVGLPLLAPAFFFALSISLINSFQVFDQVYVLTGGGPAGATTVLVERIVKNAFSFSRMGYASAMSWALFVLIFAVTLVFSRIQHRRL